MKTQKKKYIYINNDEDKIMLCWLFLIKLNLVTRLLTNMPRLKNKYTSTLYLKLNALNSNYMTVCDPGPQIQS